MSDNRTRVPEGTVTSGGAPGAGLFASTGCDASLPGSAERQPVAGGASLAGRASGTAAGGAATGAPSRRNTNVPSASPLLARTTCRLMVRVLWLRETSQRSITEHHRRRDTCVLLSSSAPSQF